MRSDPVAREVALLRHGEAAAVRGEREQLQHELAAARERSADLYEFSPCGYVTLDPHGVIRQLNQTAAHLIGFERDRMMNMPMLSWFATESRAGFLDHMRRCRTEPDQRVQSELALTQREGPGLPVQLISRRVTAGSEAGWYDTAIVDLRGRRRSEEQLLLSSQCLRMSNRVAGAACWVYDLERGKVEFSTGLRRILHLQDSDAALTLASCMAQVHPEDRQAATDAVATIRAGKLPPTLELRIRTPESGTRWLLSKTRHLVTTSGRRIIGLLLDVTRQKMTQAQLQASNAALQESAAELQRRAIQLGVMSESLQQAEERERRTIAADLHDDIGQLLVAAKMNLGGVLTQYPHEKRLEDVAAQIEAAIASVRSLTFQVSPPILEDLGLVPALEWLAADLGRQFDKRFHVHISHEPPPMSSRLRLMAFRSIRELLINSAKHAGVSDAHVQVDADNGSLVLRVWDGGCGFEADKALRSVDKQKGYGLFSIQGRLDAVGGKMNVQSAPGKGSRIELRFPRETAALSPGLPDAPGRQAAGEVGTLARDPSSPEFRIRVMVVDDHDMVRSGLSALLEQQADLEVVAEASTGERALRCAAEHCVDVVLMDVGLPGQSGVEVTRQLTARQPHPAVIGLSMHDEPAVAKAMRDAGAAAYLSKAGDTQALVQTIRNLARNLSSSA